MTRCLGTEGMWANDLVTQGLYYMLEGEGSLFWHVRAVVPMTSLDVLYTVLQVCPGCGTRR